MPDHIMLKLSRYLENWYQQYDSNIP